MAASFFRSQADGCQPGHGTLLQHQSGRHAPTRQQKPQCYALPGAPVIASPALFRAQVTGENGKPTWNPAGIWLLGRAFRPPPAGSGRVACLGEAGPCFLNRDSTTTGALVWVSAVRGWAALEGGLLHTQGPDLQLRGCSKRCCNGTPYTWETMNPTPYLIRYIKLNL